MNDVAVDLDELREKILSEPDVILDDRDIMRALIEANEKALGTNIIDLRGIAMERLESRLDRLEDTHRSVIAAAYDNLAGTNQIHRAILEMLDPVTFEGFLKGLGNEVAAILRVDCIRLVLESPSGGEGEPAVHKLGDVLSVVEPGFIDTYVTQGREGVPMRQVTLRQLRPNSDRLYGDATRWINSEALLRLDFGEGTQRGMLALGAEDPHQFRPNQATDLLGFFAGVFERQMRRWLA
ncbi:DUF484 family protein [Tropicimonas marinistellae]|uniref:DUF484 family protein n=1 Tax=Tropicimonas marinistellae TaxID=1739787 RepID=UPI0008306C40|nr:DUF484 family protein [Tropicimonas marinistellae]